MANELLLPENLRSVAGLELAARRTVDSLLPGIHQSKRTGTGQEFSQYRSYQPGDDLRQLDWKLYGRSDRFYVREAEVETNFTVRFVLDTSASMRHEDAAGLQKIDYARYLIATLAWLALQQGDALALYALNDRQVHQLTPRPGRQYFRRLLYELLRLESEGQFPKGKSLESIASNRRGRELIIFLTDLYEQEDEITDTLRRLSRTHHELLLFHLMGRNELDLSYTGVRSFEDLETGRRVQVDPEKIRRRYRAQVETHLKEIRRQMLDWNIGYELFAMDELPGPALREFLQRRSRLR